MSSTNGGDGPDPDGRWTHGGDSTTVTNQPLLPLPNSVHAGLSPHQHQALSVIQLEFARDTSARAAQAYAETLDVIKANGPGAT